MDPEAGTLSIKRVNKKLKVSNASLRSAHSNAAFRKRRLFQ